MNFLERTVHSVLLNFPRTKSMTVSLYQRILSIYPVKNYCVNETMKVLPGYFFGFHDKCPWSGNGRMLLAHRFDREANIDIAEKQEIAIGLFADGKYEHFKELSTSKAWNWQQGANLQWLGKSDRLIFNDIFKNKGVARILDCEGRQLGTVPCHVVAVNGNGDLGATFSYERLRHGSPPYSYAFGEAPHQDEPCPDSDGLCTVDLETMRIRQLFSLREISRVGWEPSMDNAYHYLSHCTFSPMEDRFAFIHEWRLPNGVSKTRLFTVGPDAKGLFLLPAAGVSHVAWRNPGHILAYCKPHGERKGLYLFIDRGGEYTPVGPDRIFDDGHPQYSLDAGKVLMDAYPDRLRMQRLFLFDCEKGVLEDLVRFRIPHFYREARRCDFHPRWNRDNSEVCFDSAHTGIRSLCILGLGRQTAPSRKNPAA